MDGWSEEEDVTVFSAFMDAGQPYSCTQWGNTGINNVPQFMTDDGNGFGNHLWNWFNLGGYVPSQVFIDHTMTVHYKMNGLTSALANTKIDQMLTACEDAGLCGCSGLDSDNDGTPDQCDDCLNLAGDVNDDLTIDILDIIGTVNIILNGGINSSSYTDCEKEDADYNSDQIINVLDIISIINNILGSRSLDIVGTAEVIIETLGNDTHIKIISDAPYSGVELSMITENNPNITLKDNSHISVEYLTIDNVTKLVAYSIVNKPFDGFTTEFIIENENIKADELIALIGSTSGHELEISYSISNDVYQYGPYSFELKNVFPNPFNPVTQVEFTIANDGFVELTAYNITGQVSAEIYSGYQSKGMHYYTWDASALPTGIYYIQLKQGSKIQTTKAILMK